MEKKTPLVKDEKPYYVDIKNSNLNNKKLMAIFYNKNKDKLRTIHFGQANANDYTTHPPEIRDQRRMLYINRHKDREDWSIPMSAGSLSRWVLWEKPNRSESINFYLNKFNLKKI